MPSEHHNRVFKPLLNNPLHGGSGASEPPFERNSATTTPSMASDAMKPPSNGPGITSTQSDNQTTTQGLPGNIPLPGATPMLLIPTFLAVPLQAHPPFHPNQQVHSIVSPVPLQTVPNIENMTKANLLPLMISRGIVNSALNTQQSPYTSFPSLQSSQLYNPAIFQAMSFYNVPVVIQAASSPAFFPDSCGPVIGPLSTIKGKESTSSSDGYITTSSIISDDDVEGITTTSLSHSTTRKYSSTSHGPSHSPKKLQTALKKQHNATQLQKHNLSGSTKAPHHGHNLHERQTLREVQLVNWANTLNRIWYLMGRGDGTNKEVGTLIELLETISRNKGHPSLEPQWLKRAKLVEVLEKYAIGELGYEYDPIVRDMAESIVGFWRSRFPRHF